MPTRVTRRVLAGRLLRDHPRGTVPPNAAIKAAPTYVGVGSATGDFASNVTATLAPTLPTVSVGDLLVAVVCIRDLSDTIATPSGWALVDGPIDSHAGNPVRGYLFTRTATGSDAVTFTKTGTNGAWRGAVLATSAALVDAHATSVSSGVSEPVLPSVTPTVPNTFILGIACHQVTGGAQATAPTGYTERVDSASVNIPNIVGNTKTMIAPVATGTVNVNISGSGGGWVAFHLALKG